MQYVKRFLQFNNLVFDEVDMVESDTYSSATKDWDKEYTFTHGAYFPKKRKSALFKASRVSMTLTLRMEKVSCDERPHYMRFAKAQLMEHGRLWAIQDGELLWAYASLSDLREYQSRRWDRVSFDVDFKIPEGVWHKADKQRTFLLPYDPCDFMECFEITDLQPCNPATTAGFCCDHCTGAKEPIHCDCCGDDCDHIDKEMAYCYHVGEIRNLDGCDTLGYRLMYDCAAAERFFGDFLSDERIGQRFCSDCGKPAGGYLISDTDVPTQDLKITLHGQVHNPYIEINGNGNWIRGDYDGILVIYSNGEVYNYPDGDCKCETNPISIDNWIIPPGMEDGWTVYPGKNRITIDFGDCCAGCAYVEVNGLTF